MIIIYWVAGLMMAAGIVSWSLGNLVFDTIVTKLETSYPSYYTGTGPDFLVNFYNYLPVILIVGSVLLVVLVESQKPRPGVFR